MQRLNELTRVQKLGYPTSFTRICCLISVSLPASLAESQRESSVNRRSISYTRGREGEIWIGGGRWRLVERFLAWSATCFVTLDRDRILLRNWINIIIECREFEMHTTVSFHQLILQNNTPSSILDTINILLANLERAKSVSSSIQSTFRVISPRHPLISRYIIVSRVR